MTQEALRVLFIAGKNLEKKSFQELLFGRGPNRVTETACFVANVN